MPKTKQRKNLSGKSSKKSAFCSCLANFYYGWRRANFGRRYIGNVRRFRILSYASMIALVILSIGIVMPFYIKPEDTEAATGTATESTMTFTSTRNAASVDLTVDSPDGTAVFNDSSHNVYFSIKTNNYSGYKVYLSTTNSNVSLVNGSNTIPALADGSNVTQANFKSGSSYNNKWGVIPSYYNSSSNSNVRGLSTTANTDMLLRNTTSANASSAHYYYVGMAVKADYSKASGAYTTSNLVIKYVANPVTYTITYNKNTTATVSNLPSTQSGSTSGTTVTLSSTVPTRSGAVFLGWCSTTTVADGGTDTCSGTTYQPGGSYGIDQTTTNTPTLRAMWDTSGCNPVATTIGTGNSTDAVCMQDMNSTVALSMTIGSATSSVQYRLIDKRDGKEYSISRLVDGKVWMTQNLDLDLSTSTTLRHSSTDLGWTTNNATATWTPAQSTISTISSWTDSSTAPRSVDAGETYYYRSHENTDQYEYATKTGCENEIENGSYGDGDGDPYCGHAHVGNYYNWPAAVASNSAGSISGIAPDSICPAGWRLPKSETVSSISYSEAAVLWYKSGLLSNNIAGGFSGLSGSFVDEYAYMDLERHPIYLVPAGSVQTGGVTAQKSWSYYWLATNYDSNFAYSYGQESNTAFYNYHEYRNKNKGMPIRCVARVTDSSTTTFTYNANGGSGSTMSSTVVAGGEVGLLRTNTYTRSGYEFVGWNTNTGGTGTSYEDSQLVYATSGSTSTVTLYAQWRKTITFATGTNIDLIIVAKKTGKMAPLYATPSNPVTLDVDTGDVVMITVVPKSGYKLNSWTQSNSGQSGTLASSTLLTTTLTVGGTAAAPTWTANGTSSSGPYSDISSVTSCSSPMNVTDYRNGISYTVGPITVSGTTYCYMLSNLRFDPRGTTLTADDSDVTSSWTVPNNSWSTHYCQARFVKNENEYYYNWYAATANTLTGVTSASGCATQARDNAALGSVCPAGWTLPTYATSGTLTPAGIWNSGVNPGMIMSTGAGGASQTGLGNYGYWWSKTRYGTGSSNYAYIMYFAGSTPSRPYSGYYKYSARSVRCMKK